MARVSICIPTYNHAQYLGDALRSASAQGFEDFEILVLDNASLDDTEALVRAAASQDPRIRYLRHPRNLGLIANLNCCIELARGSYIKVLCSDDTLEPDCIGAMARILDQEPGVTLVASARTFSDVNLKPLRVAEAPGRHARVAGAAVIAECFFRGNRIGEPTGVMFRRADAQRGFSDRYPQLVDMEMWFHLLSSGDFLALPQPLCKIRRHAGQATWLNDKKGQIVADRRKLFWEFGAAAARQAGIADKFLWDFRMAYALLRSASAGAALTGGPVREVFYPQIFARFTYPLIKVLKVFGLGIIWRRVLAQQ